MLDPLSISHFVWYFILGLYTKNNYKLVLFLSLLWEIFEYYITNYKYTRQLLIKYWPIPKKYWDENNANRISDVIINFIGYEIGNNINFK